MSWATLGIPLLGSSAFSSDLGSEAHLTEAVGKCYKLMEAFPVLVPTCMELKISLQAEQTEKQ